MNTKQILVSLLAVFVAVFVMSNVIALANNEDIVVYVNDEPGFTESSALPIAVTPGEDIDIRVVFVADEDAEKVRVKAEINGEDTDVEDRSQEFDILEGSVYKKDLTLTIPNELKDQINDQLDLTIRIWSKGENVEVTFPLTVQRESFKFDIVSVQAQKTIDAGETLPVDVVVRNRGSQDLSDIFVTVKVPALDLEKKVYFSDLSPLDECDQNDDDDDDNSCDMDDTVSGRIYLQIPENAAPGVYIAEIEASNDDASASEEVKFTVTNEFLGKEVIASTTSKTFNAGDVAEYDLLLVNPSNKLRVYRIVIDGSSGLSTSASESVVAVSAGSSKTVKVLATSDTEGIYNFNVNVFSGEDLVKTVTLSANVEAGKNTSKATGKISPVVILTIVLAIIFVVLLVVLIALLSKKPEKSEEFGESYY